MGTEWGFVLLERKNKVIIRDLTKYIVPDSNSDRNTFCLNKTNNFCMVKIHRNLVGLASVFCW